SLRPSERYLETVVGLRAVVQSSLPVGAHVLVVSKGDDELIDLDGRRGAHYPRVDGGVSAGHHPADTSEAIAGLERLRQEGAQFVVFPQTSLWWLDYYGGLRAYLERGGTVAHSEACVIYRLGAAAP